MSGLLLKGLFCFFKKQDAKAKEIIGNRFGYEVDYLENIWNKDNFNVVLPQAFLVAMDNQARWRIEQGLTNKKTIPNYLDFLKVDALETVTPEVVSILR